jgi:hypothetical protein
MIRTVSIDTKAKARMKCVELAGWRRTFQQNSAVARRPLMATGQYTDGGKSMLIKGVASPCFVYAVRTPG